MRFFITLVLLGLVIPADAQTQPNEARLGRFSYSNASTTDPTYSTFVIPLDQQKGVQLHPTTTAPWIINQSANYYPWFFKMATFTRYLMAPSGTNTVSYTYAFKNPVSAFGSSAGGTPLYIGKSYRFGFYAGGQSSINDLPAEASIQIYSKSSFNNPATTGQTPLKIEPIDLAHWKSDAAGNATAPWKTFGDNGFQKTFVTSVNGINILETTVQFALANTTDSSWGAKLKAPLLITHRALEGAQNYYFVVNYTGVTQVGTKLAWMAVTNASTPDTTGTDIPGYTLNFDSFPAWGSVLLKTPSFQGDPAPPTYYGKTAEEIAALTPRFDVALVNQLKDTTGVAVNVPAAGAYTQLNQTAELQSHPKLDKLVTELGRNPLSIANYVHNEIGLVDALGYNETGDLDEAAVNAGGMNRGALGTFLEGQGSPEEQSALLLYMLRKAGIQAAYIKPPHTVTSGVATSPVKILDQRLSNLIRMRVKGELTPNGQTPVPKFIGINYPWVAAYVPSDPNNPSSPKKWIHFFPWLKDTEVTEGLAVEGYLPSGTKSIRQWVRNFVLADSTSPLWALDAENQTPGNIFTKDLTKNLRDNWQGISIDDLGVQFRDRKFNRSTWEEFPQPCQVDASKNYTLSNSLTSDGKLYDTMDIVIASVENPTKKITLSGLKTMDFHNRRAIANFVHTSTNKFNLTFSLEAFNLGNPAAGTGDFTYGPDPYLLKKQVKTLAVDATTDKNFSFSVTYYRHRNYTGAVGTQNQALLGGWASFLGINEFDFGPNGPAAAGAPIVSYFKVGDLNAFCMNAGRVTEKMVQVHLEPYWKHEQDRNANPSLAPDYDLIQGTSAYLMGMTYYHRVSKSFESLKNLFKVHVASMRAHGFAQLGADRNGQGYPMVGSVALPGGGTTMRIQQIYPVVDMNLFRGAWAAYGDIRADAGGQQMVTGNDFLTNLMVIEQSALEDHTIRQYFKVEDADAVSTMDLIQRIQKDNNNSNNVIELTSDNYIPFKTKNYSFSGTTKTLQNWAGASTWAKVEQAFSGWDKDLVRIYITPGPVKGAKNQWQGMGTLILAKDSGAALIGQANGGYGSFSTSLSLGTYDSGTSSFYGSFINQSSISLTNGFASINPSWNNNSASSTSFFADSSAASYNQLGNMATNYNDIYSSPTSAVWQTNYGNTFSSSGSYSTSISDVQNTGYAPMGNSSWMSGNSPNFGDPVNAISGEMYADEIDLQLAGPIPLQVRRNYGSQALTYGSFGHGWKMAYFPYLFLNDDKSKIHAAELDGQVIVYRRNLANSSQEEWIVNAADNPLLTNGNGTEIGSVRNLLRNRIVRVTGSPSVYSLYGSDGNIRTYEVKSYPVYGTPTITRERPYLKKWSDASGNSLDFYFYGDGGGADPWFVPASDPSYGQLALAKASNGNSLGFHYDVYGRILDIYSGDGRRVSYEYDVDGDLRQVTLPDASWVKYDYLREQGYVGSGSKLAWYSTHLINRETRPGGRVVESDYLLYVSGDKNEKNVSIKSWQVGKASHKRRVVAQRTTSGEHNGAANANEPAAESYKPTLTGTYQYFSTTDANGLISGRTEILDAYSRKTIYYYDKSRLTKIADPQTNLTDAINGTGSNFNMRQEWYSATEVAANVNGQPGAYLAALKSMEPRGGLKSVFLYNPDGDVLEIRVTGEMDGNATTLETVVTTATYNANHLPELVTRPNRVTGQATGLKSRYYYEDPARPYSITKVEELGENGDLLRRSKTEYYDVFTVANDLTQPYSKGVVLQVKLAEGSPDEAVTTWTHAPNGFRTSEVKTSGQANQSAYPDSVLQFSYNLRGELTEERVMEGATAKKINRYAYDDMGRRIWIERLDQNRTQVGWDYIYYNKTGEVEWTDGSKTNPEDFTFTRYDGAGRPAESTAFRSRAKVDGSGMEAVPGQYAYSTTRHFYNLFGDLIKTMDPRGNTVRATFDSIGRQLSTTAYEGDWQQGGVPLATESTSYNDVELSETRTDSRGGVTKVYFTSQGKPRRQINPDGTERLWTYHLDGSVKREPISAYTYYEFTYDDVNRVTSRTLKNLGGQSLGTETVAYDRRGNTVSTTDLAGNQVVTSFDKLNRPIASSTPAAGATSAAQSATYSYDAAGFFQKTVNAMGESRETTFDALGRPLSSKSKRANGSIVSQSSSTYSSDFQSVTTITGTGSNTIQQTTWADTEGQIALVKQADGSFVRTEYDAAGNAVATTDETGQTTRTLYDGLNRPKSTILPDGATTQFTYSYPVGGGQRIERLMPESLTEVQVFDIAGRPVQKFLQGAGGVTTRNHTNFQYFNSGKEQGLLSSFVDPNGSTQTVAYDEWLRTTSLTIGTFGTSRYVKKDYLAYDVRGMFTQLRETTTPEGNSQTQVTQIDRGYDLQGNLYEEKVSLGVSAGTLAAVSHFNQTFDAAGRRWTLAKGNAVPSLGSGTGGAWGFGYRPDGLLETVSMAGGTYSYNYADNGLLQSRINPFRTHTTGSRDSRGRILSTNTKLAGSSVNVVAEAMGWTSDGKQSSYTATRLSSADASGSATWNDVHSYTYSAQRRQLTSETYTPAAGQAAKLINYEFDHTVPGGLGIRTLSYTGTGASVQGHQVGDEAGSKGWNAFGRVTNEISGFEKIGLSVQGTALGAKSIALRVGTNTELNDVEFPEVTSQTTGIWGRNLWLPSGGSFVLNGTANHPSGLYSATASNSFTIAARHFGVSNSYSGEGELTSRNIAGGSSAGGRSQTLTWDGAGRLTKVVQDETAGFGFTWKATYDGLNRRIQTQTNWATVAGTTLGQNSQQNVVQRSWYDPLVEFLEIGMEVSQVSRAGAVISNERWWNVHGPDLNGGYGGLEGMGGLEAVVNEATGEAVGMIDDAQGSMLGFYKALNTQQAASFDYATAPKTFEWSVSRFTGYGALPGYWTPGVEDTPAPWQSFGWRGKRMDVTGFYAMGARYYEPNSGRFISPDPLGHDASMGLYDYAGGDPINFVDPRGRSAVNIFASAVTSSSMLSSLSGNNGYNNYLQGFGNGWANQGVGISENSFRTVDSFSHSSPAFSFIDKVQFALDVIGTLPVIGVVADIANGCISIARGNYGAAAMSFASAIPGIGDVFGAGRIASRGMSMGASIAMHSGDNAISAYRGLSFASSNVSSFAHQAGAISTISKPLASSFTTISPLSKTAQVSMPSRSILTMPFGCFVAGTPVLSAEGERPIEALRVGERVLTPQSKDDDGTAVVPETWRKVGLEVAHEDGSKVELELLRPLTWIIEHDCKTGSRIWLEMDELGVKGWANVISVEACPQIASGKGRVILATMQRVHPQVVALALADDSELEATANHPLYSLTRNDWTAAGELQEGEILATADGSTTVRALSFLPGEHRVFNLEVESDHCYFTGHARVLSHNTCAAANTGGAQVLRNQAAGNAARDAIAASRPGSLIEQNFRVTGGLRRVDVLDGLTGIESKVGRTSLTPAVRQELARDIKIMRSGQLDAVEWHFSPSGTTGLGGPTGPLRAKLDKFGIPIVE